MPKYTLEQLVDYSKQAEQLDETGDATFAIYMAELPRELYSDETAFNGWRFSGLLEAYLVWACGPDWKSVLDDAWETENDGPQRNQ
jgi:hypothetical protein